jgi:ribosomal-protein-alanine N-acetyltransferase
MVEPVERGPDTVPAEEGERSAEGIIVRAAGWGDLDRVAAIECMSFTDPWTRQAFERLVGDHRVYFAVACEPNGEVVGYVVAWFVMDEGEVANLAVAPERRRSHIGARLLDAAIEAARSRAASAVYLEVRASNTAARNLYASRGFTEIARRKRYYRRPVEDALVLRLVLPESPT